MSEREINKCINGKLENIHSFVLFFAVIITWIDIDIANSQTPIAPLFFCFSLIFISSIMPNQRSLREC